MTIACAIFASAIACFAGTITDTFGQGQYSCVMSYTPPYDTCDVVGNEMLYDIQKASVSFANGMATVNIFTNTGAVPFGGPLTLGTFNDAGVTLMPGDIFFYNPTAGYDPNDPNSTANLKYGIALTNHGGFTAGSLYDITGGVATETAQMALQDGTDYYRWDEAVLLTGAGEPEASGLVTVTTNGDGIHKAQYEITVTVPLTSGLVNLLSSGQVGLLFSSADCGNDVIQGTVNTGYTGVNPMAVTAAATVVPEPGPGVMVLGGAMLLAVGRAWRKWSAKKGN